MILRIRVKPNSRAGQLSKDAEGNFILKVKAPPVDGKANEEVISFLSGILKIPKSKITITSGHTSNIKRLEIEAPDDAIVGRQLNEAAM